MRKITARIVHFFIESKVIDETDQEIYEYNFENKTTTKIARHPRVKETLRSVVHPTGKYAYLLRQYNEICCGY